MARKIRVLLAEDHAVVREGTRQLLEREEDMEVIGEASNGEEAIALARQCRPDVIIMDIKMPKVSGIEATKEIKSFLPSVAVLILTAYDYDEYVFAMLEAGAAGYMLKSIGGDELVHSVRAVHAGEPVLHPKVLAKMLGRFKSPATASPAHFSEVLTDREIEVMRKAAQGKSNKNIAKDLSISVRTVQAHLRSIFNKLGVGSRCEAVVRCLKTNWLTVDDLSDRAPDNAEPIS